MRNAFIISYDISDPKRLRKVFQTMYGYGDHIQLSVFRCELSATDKVRMMAKLDRLLHHDEDQVLIIDIGPSGGRADGCIEALGRAYIPRGRVAIVV
jgi:CRISPR-associated protein Cas2